MDALQVPDGPRARLVLALVVVPALLALSGCSAAGSISLDPVETDASLAEHATRDVGPPDAADGTERTQRRRIVAGAVENGSIVVRDHRRRPMTTDRPVTYDGAVYELNATVVAEREVPQVDVRIDYNASDLPARTVQYADLPAADRAALEPLVPPETERRVDGYDFGTVTEYEDPAASVLVGAETVVVYEGERYLVAAERDGTVTTHDYEYTARQVAPDAAAYGASLRAEYGFTLSGLTEAERAVVEEARNDTYYAEDTDDEAFVGVLDRFRAHEAVVSDDYSGEWIVRWRGDLYWARLRFDGFVD